MAKVAKGTKNVAVKQPEVAKPDVMNIVATVTITQKPIRAAAEPKTVAENQPKVAKLETPAVVNQSKVAKIEAAMAANQPKAAKRKTMKTVGAILLLVAIVAAVSFFAGHFVAVGELHKHFPKVVRVEKVPDPTVVAENKDLRDDLDAAVAENENLRTAAGEMAKANEAFMKDNVALLTETKMLKEQLAKAENRLAKFRAEVKQSPEANFRPRIDLSKAPPPPAVTGDGINLDSDPGWQRKPEENPGHRLSR